MRTALILNPVSGISTISTKQEDPEANEKRILACLRTYDIEPQVYHTTPEDTGQALATRVSQEGVELVIASGGDGTIHAVASGLIGTKTMLGIIPTGTMNNLAHSLDIPTCIEEACHIIATGETRAIDIGMINNQAFLEVAGIGLEAALFPAAEDIKRPDRLSTMRGVVNGLCTVLRFKPIKLRVTFDENQRHPYEAIQVTICNAPYYGVHMQIVPHILMDDGLLDVVIYRNFSKLEYLRHAISISQGRRRYTPKIAYRQVRSLHIITDRPVEIQADGLPHGQTPAEVRVYSGALQIRVPGAQVPGPHDESISDSAIGKEQTNARYSKTGS